MNKEVQEAKKYLEKYIKWETYRERNLEKDIKTILNYIQELEDKIETRDKQIECLGLNTLTTAVKGFRELLERYIPKQKIRDKLEEVESVLDMYKDQKVAKYKIRMLEEEIVDLQELLNEEE